MALGKQAAQPAHGNKSQRSRALPLPYLPKLQIDRLFHRNKNFRNHLRHRRMALKRFIRRVDRRSQNHLVPFRHLLHKLGNVLAIR